MTFVAMPLRIIAGDHASAQHHALGVQLSLQLFAKIRQPVLDLRNVR
jgi:hypothetical protein